MVSNISAQTYKGIASALEAPITPLTKTGGFAVPLIKSMVVVGNRPYSERYPLARLIFVVYLVTLHGYSFYWDTIRIRWTITRGNGHAIPGAMPSTAHDRNEKVGM